MSALIIALSKDKTQKSVKNTEKMFKAIEDSGDQVSSVLQAFQNAGSGPDLFSEVINEYKSFLSDTFWGEILNAIDWETATTAITDVLGPIFESVGDWIGDKIEEAPIGSSIGIAMGGLIGSFVGHPLIGAAVGGAIGYLIEQAAKFFGVDWEPLDPKGEEAFNIAQQSLQTLWDRWILVNEAEPTWSQIEAMATSTPLAEYNLQSIEDVLAFLGYESFADYLAAIGDMAEFPFGLQQGGVVKRSGTYRLAEQNRPELVAPLDEFYMKLDELLYKMEQMVGYQRRLWEYKEAKW